MSEPEPLAIDLVSPLPPVRSGIADYSADLLPRLAERADVRLVALPDQPVDPELARRYPVVAAHRLGEDGRLPLYQMGNNRWHTAVHGLALRVPGVLTLHDVVLHHFLIDCTFAAGDFDGYRRRLAADHGWIGELAAMPLRWPGGAGNAVQFSLAAHRTLLGAQRGVLTHSEWAAGWLAEEIEGLRVRAVPMGVPLPPEPDAAAGRRLRAERGIPLDAPVLGSFGFQTPMKRTDVAIRTLAAPGLERAHLLVAGELAPILRLEDEARQAGVAERVHFLGFLPFDGFEAAIAATDVCLNLRYPTAGETSASLLRILAVGRPAVVSDHGQSADLDGEGVVKVPPGEGEAEALAARLGELLADRARLAAMGAAARAHVALRHRPSDAAAAIVAACRAFAGEAPLEPGPPRLPPPTTLTWDALAGELEVEGAERPWAVGERRRCRVRLRNRSLARWLAGERPDGGVALEVQALAGGRVIEERWHPLPVDLDPGEEHVFSFDLRRPPGPFRLRLMPQVLGREGFAELGGPSWEEEL